MYAEFPEVERPRIVSYRSGTGEEVAPFDIVEEAQLPTDVLAGAALRHVGENEPFPGGRQVAGRDHGHAADRAAGILRVDIDVSCDVQAMSFQSRGSLARVPARAAHPLLDTTPYAEDTPHLFGHILRLDSEECIGFVARIDARKPPGTIVPRQQPLPYLRHAHAGIQPAQPQFVV